MELIVGRLRRFFVHFFPQWLVLEVIICSVNHFQMVKGGSEKLSQCRRWGRKPAHLNVDTVRCSCGWVCCIFLILDKNETSRFLGEGVSFKAKLIGILEVSEARGDRMCQEALADLKMAIRAAGEHKQRITINIAIDGLRLRDEKTGVRFFCLIFVELLHKGGNFLKRA